MKPNCKQDAINQYAAKRIKYKAMRLIHTNGFSHSDRDDLEQELAFALLERLPNYDAKKAKKSTFIDRVINCKISNLIRDRKCAMRDYRREALSLNNCEEEFEVLETITRAAIDHRLERQSMNAEEMVDLRHDVALVLAKLPAEMRDLCNILMTGNVSDAVREMNISRGQVSRYLKAIRKVFEQEGVQKN